MDDKITLAHGSGGKAMFDLIRQIFYRHFSNEILSRADDAAHLGRIEGRLAFTTDSFVVSPVFFHGGNIGKLAVCGTVNDLASAGAVPRFISCGFILEEGFFLSQLEEIVASMAETARECGVVIATGDTKVVPKGAADRIFINTSGIGIIPEGVNLSGAFAKPGDQVIITGPIGDHGCAILLERENFGITAPVKSDCAPLAGMVQELLQCTREIHVVRDPTRGGAAATLNEIALQSSVGIRLYEERIPVRDEVRGVCEMLGLDPLYVANEGKMLVIVPPGAAEQALAALRSNRYGQEASMIGEVLEAPAGRVFMRTYAGGNRIVDMPAGEQLPRIC